MNTRLSRRAALGLAALVAAYAFASAPSAVAQDVQLAIKGYDPVAYFTDREADARACRTSSMSGMSTRYRFSSAEHRELFKADPVRYAPQFGNFCAMALAKGEIVVANPENWLISDGKLYVFGKPCPGRPRSVPEGSCRKHHEGEPEPADLPKHLTVSRPRGGAAMPRPALRRPSRRCSRSAGLEELASESCGSNVGSRRRIIATTRAASSARLCCGIGGRQHDPAEVRACRFCED